MARLLTYLYTVHCYFYLSFIWPFCFFGFTLGFVWSPHDSYLEAELSSQMFILSLVQLHFHQNTEGMYCWVLIYILFRQNHLLHVQIIFRPHCRTVYVDAAYCYIPNNVVCRSVYHSSEPCKNSWTDRDAVWVQDSGWPKNHVLDGGPDPPMGRGNFEGKGGPL